MKRSTGPTHHVDYENMRQHHQRRSARTKDENSPHGHEYRRSALRLTLPVADTRRLQLEVMIFAIETSCDDTCAAVVEPDGGGRSRTSYTPRRSTSADTAASSPRSPPAPTWSVSTASSRRRWMKAEVNLDDVSRVAVTTNPGLIGALLVGVAAAKGLAYARELPLSARGSSRRPRRRRLPHGPGPGSAVRRPDRLWRTHGSLLRVSPGPLEMRLLGETLDDAAGEALDKGARMLGLGFPGGPAISKSRRQAGDPVPLRVPGRPEGQGITWTSASPASRPACSTGLKDYADGESLLVEELPHLAASYEAAVIEALYA